MSTEILLLITLPSKADIFYNPNFSLRKEQFTPIGIVLVSLSWCKGEWIGLTLGATYSGVFSTIAQFENNIQSNPDNSLISIHRQ